MAEKRNRYIDEKKTKSANYRKNQNKNREAARERHSAVRERKAVDRKVLSYEDVPIDEYSHESTAQPELVKRLFKVLLIILVCVVALLVVLNWDDLSPENVSGFIQNDLLGVSHGDGYPTPISGTEVNSGNFKLMDSTTPVYISDTSAVFLNDNAGQRQNRQHAFASPSLECNKNNAILFNVGGTGYRIFDHKDELYANSVDNKIFDADIAENGSYVFVTQSGDYLAELTAYTKDHTLKYKYSFADYYIQNVSISNDGSKAIVSGFSSNNGSLVSAVYIIDFSTENYIAKYEFSDIMIYDVCFYNNGNAVAIGDNKSYFFNLENNERQDIDYDSCTLTSYSADKEKGLVMSLAKQPDGRDCDVQIISTEGETTARFSTGTKITSISLGYDNIAALSSNMVFIYNKSGGILQTQDVGHDAVKVCLADDNTLYLLSITDIKKYYFTYEQN